VPLASPLPGTNRLVSTLPRADRQRLLEGCETVELAFAEKLSEPPGRLRHVYFPTASFISLIAPLDKHASLEVGLIGDEGMLGASLALGVDFSPLRSIVQGAGPSLRMSAAAFQRELKRSPALDRIVRRYLSVVLAQLAQAAACTRFHVLEERLARWLLMTQDRAHADEFRITHEFMSGMLGVRRVGVTEAATALQERGLIRYHRGDITVLDRARLEQASCTCYAADTAAYLRLMA
jgi:hypothetical protein